MPGSGNPGQWRLRRHWQWAPGARESPWQAEARAWLLPIALLVPGEPERRSCSSPQLRDIWSGLPRPYLQGWPLNGRSYCSFCLLPLSTAPDLALIFILQHQLQGHLP